MLQFSPAAGAGDGSLMFCMVGQPQPMTKIELAHDNPILGVGFHPNGHMLASCECRRCRSSADGCFAVAVLCGW
jgi:hypothetical protein